MEYFDVLTVARRKDDPPFNPYICVCLAHSPDSYKVVGGRIVLTHMLMGDVEIDEAINWLIKDLEKIRKEAKRELKKAQENRFKYMLL